MVAVRKETPYCLLVSIAWDLRSLPSWVFLEGYKKAEFYCASRCHCKDQHDGGWWGTLPKIWKMYEFLKMKSLTSDFLILTFDAPQCIFVSVHFYLLIKKNEWNFSPCFCSVMAVVVSFLFFGPTSQGGCSHPICWFFTFKVNLWLVWCWLSRRHMCGAKMKKNLGNTSRHKMTL